MTQGREVEQQRQQVLEQAGRCVRCAYCLPHCPTYRLLQSEADSPRGRIALARRLAATGSGENSLSAPLERCLGCGACEAACPSGVGYRALLHGARALLAAEQPPLRRGWRQLRLLALSAAPYHPLLVALLRRSWPLLRHLLRRLQPPLAALAPPRLTPLPSLPAPDAAATGARVALFTGCLARLVDGAALTAAVRLLTALGCQVAMPAQQRCCGAMHAHSGERTSTLQAANREAFAGFDALLYLASGCGSELQSQKLGLPVVEISDYLSRHPKLAQLPLRPLAQRIRLHTPCSQKAPFGDPQAPWRLLAQIPQLELLALEESDHCCGGAGLYLLEQPHLAARLVAAPRAAIQRDPPAAVVTSNLGCALHLRAALAPLGVPVLHPVELLAQQLIGPEDGFSPLSPPSTYGAINERSA